MPTALEGLGSDSRLQDHWIRRVVAFIIDSIVVGACLMIVAGIIAIPFLGLMLVTGPPWHFFNFLTVPFFGGILGVLYFVFLEFHYGSTLGKRIMRLKTTKLDGKKPPLKPAFIRNISKIYWVLVLVDAVIGLATPGNPHQKASDRIAGTAVVPTAASPLTGITAKRSAARYCPHCGGEMPPEAKYCPHCGKRKK